MKVIYYWAALVTLVIYLSSVAGGRSDEVVYIIQRGMRYWFGWLLLWTHSERYYNIQHIYMQMQGELGVG